MKWLFFSSANKNETKNSHIEEESLDESNDNKEEEGRSESRKSTSNGNTEKRNVDDRLATVSKFQKPSENTIHYVSQASKTRSLKKEEKITNRSLSTPGKNPSTRLPANVADETNSDASIEASLGRSSH